MMLVLAYMGLWNGPSCLEHLTFSSLNRDSKISQRFTLRTTDQILTRYLNGFSRGRLGATPVVSDIL